MTTNKLQEAITLIKSGDRQAGQQLMTEVLRADPRNETAWLWMSALVTGEKRRFCLEKVLSINPNHPQARQQLAKLEAAVAPAAQEQLSAVAVEQSVSQPSLSPLNVTSSPAPVSEPLPSLVSMPVTEPPAPQVWGIPGRKKATIIYLLGDDLLALDVAPGDGPRVIDNIRKGITPKELYAERKKATQFGAKLISVSKIVSIKLLLTSLIVRSLDASGKQKTDDIDCNKENSESILKALSAHLGPGFRRVSQPTSRLNVILPGLFFFLITACGTGFFYWLAQGLATEGGTGGSARARAIANLLLLLGPNGVLCIGGVLVLLVFLGIIFALINPPTETLLTRVSTPGDSK